MVEKGNDTELSFVLGSYNRRKFLERAIQSIRQNGIEVPYEIIVVDGGSTDGSLKWLSKQKDILTIVHHNRGSFRGKPLERRSWGYFMNLGFKCARGRFIVMISDDTLLVPQAAMNALHHCEKLQAQGRKVGAVAFYWREWPQEQEYKVGLALGDRMFVNHGMFLREAVEEVGWIEEESFQFYYADVDLSLKLWRKGYEVVDCPAAFVEHFRHSNRQVRRRNLHHEGADRSAYLEKWGNEFFNPEKHAAGKWIYYDYNDSCKTAKKFPKINVYLSRILLMMEKIKTNLF
jgi:GT2 family glycosyltransferase